MFVPLRSSYHLSTVTADFTCRQCGAYRKAHVRTFGVGSGFFGTAHGNAVRNAAEAVPMLLALKRCPACGARDERRAVRNLRLRRVCIAVIALIAVSSTVAMFAIVRGDSELRDVAPLIGVGMAIIYALFCYRTFGALRRSYPTDVEDVVALDDAPLELSWREAPASPTAADGAWKWI
jgi:hypothetical protein